MEYTFHYYGSLVRKFFMAAAFIMLLSLPFINSLLPVPLFYSLLAITVLSIIAGMTSIYTAWSTTIDEAISILAVIIFEYYAVTYYIQYSWTSPLFIVNQILALDFLIALYYATKNLRRVTPIK